MSTANKLTYLNATKDKLKNVINYAGANITNDTFRSYPEKLYDKFVDFVTNGTDSLYSGLPKVTGEGTELTLNNTANGVLKLDLKGNTSQDGEPTPENPQAIHVVSGDNSIDVCGKNLFKEWVSGSVDNLGNFTPSARNRTDYIQIQPSTTYTLWREDTGFATYIYEYNENKVWIKKSAIVSANTTLTLTTDENTKYAVLYQYTEYSPTNKAQLELGNQATTYEAYQGYTKEINLGVENLWKNQLSGFLPQSGSYPTTNSTYPNARYILVNLLKGQSITISGSTSTMGRVRYIDKDTNQVVGIINNGETEYYKSTGTYVGQFTEGTITAKKDFIVGIMDMGGAVNNLVVNYGTTPQTISDNPIEMCEIEEYEDKLFKNTTDNPLYNADLELNKWYKYGAVGKVVLDGSDTFNLGAWSAPTYTNTKAYRVIGVNNIILNNNPEETINMFSNMLIKNNQAYLYSNDTIGCAIYSTNIYLRVPLSIAPTLPDFKTWLSTHNLVLYQPLETPTTTQITDTTLISQLEAIESAMSYENQTNISQTNADLPFVIGASAIKKYSE